MTIEPGKFRVRGDIIDVIPATEDDIIRIELLGNKIERISNIHHLTGETIAKLDGIKIFPAKQFVVPEEKQRQALEHIREELKEQLPNLPELEAQRLKKRVNYDLEMIKEMGYCSGIENYSRYFDGRKKGTPPFVLLDYFPKDFLLIIDESHQTIPQSNGMYKGDYARKKNLVEYGFRLPCAFDNRPLKFKEFETYFKKTLFVSATPGPYEKEHSQNIVELIIRPTGLLDPTVEVRPIEGQMKDLIKEIKATSARNNRILITTLTKRMAEDLTNYLAKEDIKVRYLHAEVESLDRIELIRQLRAGEFDVLVGINLLREGLDIPEVELVAVLDADKEGYLRNEISLIQTMGRAARNVDGRVILYADVMTKSIRSAVAITTEHRKQQKIFNKKHHIVPTQIHKKVQESQRTIRGTKHLAKGDIEKQLIELDAQMKKAAEELNFEKAIELRDAIKHLQGEVL
jgi:excinuclease ABC subunit B